MTEEQIRPIAENYVEAVRCIDPNGEYTEGDLVCAGIGTTMIVARMLEKQIKELQEENKRLEKGGCRLVNCNGREKLIELRKAKIKIEQLEEQIEKMKCCQNCENWNWKHSRCEKKLKGDCFKQSKWVLRKILSKEYE